MATAEQSLVHNLECPIISGSWFQRSRLSELHVAGNGKLTCRPARRRCRKENLGSPINPTPATCGSLRFQLGALLLGAGNQRGCQLPRQRSKLRPLTRLPSSSQPSSTTLHMNNKRDNLIPHSFSSFLLPPSSFFLLRSSFLVPLFFSCSSFDRH